MHTNCLIVDDETELAQMTAEYFRMFDVATEYVESGEACLRFFEEHTADLVLLDINLGDGSGFDVCKKLREDLQLPILFISARQRDDDVLIARSSGGDYIKKPYSLSVLLAKVKVNLKRMEQIRQASQQAAPSGEGFAMDPQTLSVTVDGRQISLKPKEYALLSCLYAHHDTIVTKEVLFDEVWGDSYFSDSTLNVHIRKLREKIETDPNQPSYIKTIWGTGYILELK